MTNINCSSNCIYQKNGKCSLDNVQSITSSVSEDCAYFQLDPHHLIHNGLLSNNINEKKLNIDKYKN